jgi:putative heme-binding domain-containing protein
VRYAARIALEHQDPRLWSEAVLAERDPRAALEGLLALVRAGPDAESGAVIDRAAGILEGSADETLCLDALRVLDLALIRLAPPEETKGRLRDRLDPFYPSGIGPLDRALIACLVHLEAPGVAERALARMEEAESQEERIWIAYALRALRSGWTPESERRFSELLDAEVERVRGGESARGYVGRIREEAAAILGIEPLAAPPTAEDGSVAISSRTAGGGLGEGERLYRKAGCHECHRFEGEGESRGPDLTGVGARFSARDLLVAIREPSREVPDVWADTEFWGEGDDLLAVGRLLDESTHAFVVETTSGERLSLPRGRVVERRAHPLSRMPEGLLDGLSEEEVLRIIEFLRGLNSPPR